MTGILLYAVDMDVRGKESVTVMPQSILCVRNA